MLTFIDIKERGDLLESLDIPESMATAAAALILGYDGARPLVLLAVDRNGLMMPTLYHTPTLEEGSQLQLVCRALCRSHFPLLRCLVPTGDTQTYNLLNSSGWSYDGVWKGLSRTPDGQRQDGYIFTFEEVDNGRQHF